ncbi:MAG: sigma-70 family RNA polymerase sigma factor [Nitrospira sp.]|nr:MAG: sigma-70 family RNA polymerase sigma factor [Nitrospira sp.]
MKFRRAQSVSAACLPFRGVYDRPSVSSNDTDSQHEQAPDGHVGSASTAMPVDHRGSADEAKLIARSLTQDSDAFGQLVERYATVIVNLAYRMVGDRTEAEDLAQETFVAAFKALPRFRAESKFSTWLYRIAANKCKDWLRAKRPGQSLHDVDVEEVLDDRVVEDRTPERLLSQQQVAAQLDRAIQRLPPLYREAFVLKHIEGLSYEEMQEILSVNADTLKMRVYKGRLQLSRELAELKEA